jgi:hypothetical protein
VEIACADCGCLVDRGVVIKPCAIYPDCCCRDLLVRVVVTRVARPTI